MTYLAILTVPSLVINKTFKETKSVTMNIFQKKKKKIESFVKIEFSYVFTINIFSTAENCMKKLIIL